MSAYDGGFRRLQSTEDFVEEKKYSAAEMERILKIQEVIAKAMAGDGGGSKALDSPRFPRTAQTTPWMKIPPMKLACGHHTHPAPHFVRKRNCGEQSA